MGAPLIARLLAAIAILAPWLVWLPSVRGPLAVVLAGSLALLGAFHGWGRLVARVIGRHDVSAALAMWWGLALVVALAGIAIALHHYDARLLVIGGTIAHSAELALAFAATAEAIEVALHWERLRFWVIPVAMVVVLAVAHVLGAAGANDTRPFDDDGQVIAQVKRLLDTGALADPIGYARGSQLGGHVALCGLTGAFADISAVRMIDAVGFVMLLVLALALLRPRDAASAMWAVLLVLLASAVTIKWTELAPLWIAAGLLVALHASLDELGAELAVALLAGAAIALRGELIAPALVLVAAAWWQNRRDRTRTIAIVLAVIVAVFPYLIASALAWSRVDPTAHALLQPSHGPLAGRFALFALVTLATTPVLLLPFHELGSTRLSWLAVAFATGVATVASQLGAERPFATPYLWVFAIAGVIVLAIELAGRADVPRVALVLALLACVIVDDARTTRGRYAWHARYFELFENAEQLRNAAPTADDGYAAILAAVPAGERVAVWVQRPDTLDYARHDIVDLRTPRSARLRATEAADTHLDRLVAASRAHWLLVEPDDSVKQRANDSTLYAALCWHAFPWCSDSLDALAFRHHVVAERDGAQLIALP
jgi:hypothetical protein